jgi:hypothetical protein
MSSGATSGAEVKRECNYCATPFTPNLKAPVHLYCTAACRNSAFRRGGRRGVDPRTSHAISCAIAESDLLRRGMDVYRASSRGTPADIIAIDPRSPDESIKIKVRTCRPRKDGWVNIPKTPDGVVVALVADKEVRYHPTLEVAV